MWQLLIVQFFSWFALFSMWVYTTPAVAQHFYGTTDPNSTAYQDAGNWVGILFGIYNGFSAIVALLLPVSCEIYYTESYPHGGFGYWRAFVPVIFSYSGPSLPYCSNDWCWYCLGKHFGYALCFAGEFNSAKKDGNVYGFVQYVNYHSSNCERYFWWNDIAIFFPQRPAQFYFDGWRSDDFGRNKRTVYPG